MLRQIWTVTLLTLRTLPSRRGAALVIVISMACAVGALLSIRSISAGLTNFVHATVETRRTEIATLRAIGFNGMAVVISVARSGRPLLAEALLLAAGGSLIGAGVAWAAFNGNLHAIGGNVITLAVTPGLLANGVFFACFLAFVGGIFPALRAARRPVVDALQAS